MSKIIKDHFAIDVDWLDTRIYEPNSNRTELFEVLVKGCILKSFTTHKAVNQIFRWIPNSGYTSGKWEAVIPNGFKNSEVLFWKQRTKNLT